MSPNTPPNAHTLVTLKVTYPYKVTYLKYVIFHRWLDVIQKVEMVVPTVVMYFEVYIRMWMERKDGLGVLR